MTQLRPPTRIERLVYAITGRWPESYVTARIINELAKIDAIWDAARSAPASGVACAHTQPKDPA